jgi:hypothetical protein
MKKVKSPAIKRSSGKVITGAKHKDIPATGKKGFTLTDGSFVGRIEAGKVAKAAGQAKKMPSSALHSSNLKKK